MGLGGFIRKQFIDVIQWTEDGEGMLAWRFPMRDQEIQYGAQLTVREAQLALFVNEGRIADAFGPGQHTLVTRNIPLLTNLMHWDKLFESPFKSDVYFFSSRLQVNQKWGTPQPVTIRDREFGAVRVRAFGTYTWRIVDPARFHQEVSGTRDHYHVADLEPQLRSAVVSHLSQAVADGGVPFLDLAANLLELGGRLQGALAPTFERFGLGLDAVFVESVTLPEELQKRLDERIGMNIVGNLGDYTRFQVAQSIPTAAANPGGLAAAGTGLGAGIGLGQVMSDALKPPSATPAADGSSSAKPDTPKP